MKRYAITIAYDGTDYFGWQVQKNRKTVAGVLQKTFKKIFARVAAEGAVAGTFTESLVTRKGRRLRLR